MDRTCNDDYIAELAHIDEPDAARSIVTNAEIRSKIQMIKVLGFIRKTDKEWFADLLKLLDYVDNDLRIRRNLYIHADWISPKGRLTRRLRKPKLLRPQAFQLALSSEETIPVKIAELRKLAKDMRGAFTSLIFLFSYVIRRDPTRSLPSIYWKQYQRA